MVDMPGSNDVEPSDASLRDIRVVDPKALRARGRGLYAHRKIRLRTLRVAIGMTQADVAQSGHLMQGQVSGMEAGGDHKVSTLTRYAMAIGGELDVAIIIDGRRYSLAGV
ncbi:MAG: helix-turn-helix transcriptional regulator [Myxococcales bacterium]